MNDCRRGGRCRTLPLIAAALLIAACSTTSNAPQVLDSYGEQFVRLGLALGEHDADYVDAYHGPAHWREEAAQRALGVAQIQAAASEAATQLRARPALTGIAERRRVYLARQFEALAFRARMLGGETFTFDEESFGLYDAVAPRYDAKHFEHILNQLDKLLPPGGELAARLDSFSTQFVIPNDRLDAVFNAAIDECALRTRRHLELPRQERFHIEYVTDKAWSGYNWFQGDAHSLIQVNTDLPIRIERAIKLACHEGYPGHHVFNSLLEKRLYKGRGWVEFSIFPLFSPTGLIAEGSANYGVRLAFPNDERVEYETRVLFPLAGLDGSQAARYYQVRALTEQLDYAGNEAARRYLDGHIDREQAQKWLVRYGLSEPARAAQRVRFFDKYRSYVINYNLGQDMVARFVERAGPDATTRWTRFEELLSNPYLPSQLE